MATVITGLMTFIGRHTYYIISAMSYAYVIREFDDGDSRLEVSDYGGQVLSWAPAGRPSVIWRPGALMLGSGVPIRGGVPVVVPWFGSGYADGRALGLAPKHGSARVRFWRCEERPVSGATVRYVLELPAEEAGPGGQPLRAVTEVIARKRLTMTLTVTNVGHAATRCEMALHTYLHVGNVRHVLVRGLRGAGYWDAVSGDPNCVQLDDDISFEGETDRVYDASRPIEVCDPGLGRVIRVCADGAMQTVVWNPGQVAGDAIRDMAPGEWASFICVEAAVCRERALELAPGASHTLTQTLSLA